MGHSGTTGDRAFHHLVGNTLLASVINFTVWFAITFFVYIETRSVFATGIIAGLFLALTALSGIWFGSLVDHHRKRTVMLASSAVSFVLYAACLALYLAAGRDEFGDAASPVLWAFVLLLMVGVVAGNLRTIALSTTVTLLVPEDRRDRANGLVGTVTGVSFLVTSVISGLLVGFDGMRSALVLALVVTAGSIAHLAALRVPGDRAVAGQDGPQRVDLRGTLAVVAAVPGLGALIVFSTINNLLGGAFMALADPYGLSLVSVQAWGLLWGVLSTGFLLGGAVIARRGLGRDPVRTLLLVNLVLWAVCAVVGLRSSIVLFGIGMFVYLCLVPFAEASEQTVLQRVVPIERQGRVLGFAQSVEQAASPATAFLVSPVAQFVVIPFLTTGAGVDLIGGWFGTGPDRGIGLIFVVSGLLGLALTVVAIRSRQYRALSRRYLDGIAREVAPDRARAAPG